MSLRAADIRFLLGALVVMLGVSFVRSLNPDVSRTAPLPALEPLWLAVGLALYFFYGYRNSKLRSSAAR